MTPWWRSAALVRFVLAGLVNSGVTYVLFLLLARVLDARIAYTIVYILGIGLAYVLNTLFVFKVSPTKRTALQYPLIYGVQYLYGLAAVSALTLWLHASNAVAMGIVIVTSVPLSFLLNRLALTRRGLT